MRWLPWVFAGCVVLQASCASTRKPTADVVAALMPDVTEVEWRAAIPAETIGATNPQRVSGPISPGDPDLPLGSTASVALDIVYRANGTVGLYRVLKVTHQGYATQMMAWLRAQRFQPVVHGGVPIAVRGTQNFVATRAAMPLRAPSNEQ